MTEFTLGGAPSARITGAARGGVFGASTRVVGCERVRARTFTGEGIPCPSFRWGVAGVVMLSVGALAMPAVGGQPVGVQGAGPTARGRDDLPGQNAPAGTQCEAWLVFASQEPHRAERDGRPSRH